MKSLSFHVPQLHAVCSASEAKVSKLMSPNREQSTVMLVKALRFHLLPEAFQDAKPYQSPNLQLS